MACPRFVIGDRLLLLVVDPVLPFESHDDLVHALVQILGIHLQFVFAGGKQGRFVDQVLQLGARKTDGSLGKVFEVHVVGKGNVPGMEFQYFVARHPLRQFQGDLPVEAPGPHQCVVQDVGPVGGRHDNDRFLRRKTVHFGKDLVQGLLALLVPAPDTYAAGSPYGIQLVYENDCRGVLLGVFEQVPDPRCADTDKDLYELGTADAEERHARFARGCPGHQRLAHARRTCEEDPLGKLRTQGEVLGGVLEEINDLDQFVLGIGEARHVLEGHVAVRPGIELGLGLAHAEDIPSAPAHAPALHLPGPVNEYRHQQYPGQEVDHGGGKDGIALSRSTDAHVLLSSRLRSSGSGMDGKVVSSSLKDVVPPSPETLTGSLNLP